MTLSGFLYSAAREDVEQDQARNCSSSARAAVRSDGWRHLLRGKRDDQRVSLITGPGLVGPVTFISPADAHSASIATRVRPATICRRPKANSGVYAQGGYRLLEDKPRLRVCATRTTRRTPSVPSTPLGGPVNQPANSAPRASIPRPVKYHPTDDAWGVRALRDRLPRGWCTCARRVSPTSTKRKTRAETARSRAGSRTRCR